MLDRNDSALRRGDLNDLSMPTYALQNLARELPEELVEASQPLPAMEASVSAAPPPPLAGSGAQWIKLVTGLLPDPVYAAAADRARRVVVMPCPGLERSLSLFDAGEATMQELTDVLRVHQTTISRQVAALRKAGLVSQDDRRRIVVAPEEIRAACQTLLEAL